MSRHEYHPSRSKSLPSARRLNLKRPSKPRGTPLAKRFEAVIKQPVPAVPIDSSLLPWDEIFALRGFPNADGL